MPSKSSRGGPAGARGIEAKGPGKGKLSGKTILGASRRHRKILKDSIQGVTKPAIRRMARRGGVKRISAGIYSEIRVALRDRLAMILRTCTIYVEHRNAKTVTTNDVICSLRRFGRPIYGFDPDTYDGQKKARRPETNYDPETARRPETNDGLKKVRRPETNDGLKKARRVGAGTK